MRKKPNCWKSKENKRKQHITQGTVNGDKTKSREYLCDSTPKTLTCWHTQDTCYMLDLTVNPLQLNWFGDYLCWPKVLVKLIQWTISIAGSKHAAQLKAKIQGSQLEGIRCKVYSPWRARTILQSAGYSHWATDKPWGDYTLKWKTTPVGAWNKLWNL